MGRRFGCELVVDVDEQSIELTMELPGKGERAWDDRLYKRGQMYYKGYANPIKPSIEYNKDLENPDKAVLYETVVEDDDGDEVEEGHHAYLISSPRYREYMRQHLISQILNPREQWRLILIAVIAVGGLLLINLMVSLSAAGVI